MMSYYLMMHTGYSSFPNIYFGEEHVGGFDDLKAYLQDPQCIGMIMDKNGIVSSCTTTEDETNGLSEGQSTQRGFLKLAE
jgi:hypothetical protein